MVHPGRHEIIAKAKIQSKLAGNSPIILNVRLKVNLAIMSSRESADELAIRHQPSLRIGRDLPRYMSANAFPVVTEEELLKDKTP